VYSAANQMMKSVSTLINYLWTKDKLYLKIQLIPCLGTNQLMLHREKIAVCSEIHTQHTNILRGQTVELLNVKLAVYKDPVPTAQ
jgi:hypothetical protein